MISSIALVALRELRQITRTRGFLFVLVILPAALIISILAQSSAHRQSTIHVAVEGPPAEAQALRAALSLDDGRRSMTALVAYLKRYFPATAEARALTAQSWPSDADIADYQKSGGAAPIVNRVQSKTHAGVPRFVDVVPRVDVSGAPPDGGGGRTSSTPSVRISLVGSGGNAWSDIAVDGRQSPPAEFLTALQNAIPKARLLAAAGGDRAPPADALRTRIRLSFGTVAGGTITARSVIPFAVAYLLFISLLVTGSWMLQGAIEERSNKLLEAILACVSPTEVMYGKLVGTAAIGLCVVLFWIASCAAIVFWLGAGSDMTGSAAMGMVVSQSMDMLSPLTALAMIYFFVTGFLMVSIIFLAIGAVSDSFREAQGFLSPVLLVIILPLSLAMRSMLSGNGSSGVELLTWIPIYTPFAVIARIATIRPAEVVGAGILLAVFVALELIMLDRLFRRSLLRSGGHWTLGDFVRLGTKRPAN